MFAARRRVHSDVLGSVWRPLATGAPQLGVVNVAALGLKNNGLSLGSAGLDGMSQLRKVPFYRFGFCFVQSCCAKADAIEQLNDPAWNLSDARQFRTLLQRERRFAGKFSLSLAGQAD